ncbi:hypothetical protein TRIP_B330360 [uncultured Desulfatiglans sp.]|uniref:Uncharacterized protein n=1 Tax=Uncultured Desulfatiglans sp. TaxID=1748965 RepID=A0A653A8A5_UNCDX|nr:hypothetical protein TRIP_B330360 [uncultured Desulfatiglans sp.]
MMLDALFLEKSGVAVVPAAICFDRFSGFGVGAPVDGKTAQGRALAGVDRHLLASDLCLFTRAGLSRPMPGTATHAGHGT